MFTGGGGIAEVGELSGDLNRDSTKSLIECCLLEDVIKDSKVDDGIYDLSLSDVVHPGMIVSA